jgi:multidrug efflux pump subunit AcrA (membrane-fusion protein)
VDIPREPPKKRKRYVYGGVAVAAVVFTTVALGNLKPAAPGVDGATVYRDSVRRGTMVRQVRGPGTLVPEQIRWVPAVTAGRVERKLLLPGTKVDSHTVLIELSNPEVQLELLEAERQLSQARAELVNLRTTLETQRLNQEGTVATVRAEQLQAKRNAEAGEKLAERGLIAEAELATLRERAEELAIRLDAEQQRLKTYTESAGPQIEVQEGQLRRLQDIVQFQRNRVASMRVQAGTHGVLQDVPVEEGQWVIPGATLARVVQPERLKAVLRIPETQARDVVLGQAVLVDTRTDTILGRVTRIDPSVQNGAVNVDVSLEGDLPPGARPDLSVDGTIEIDRIDDALYVGRPAYGQAYSTVGLFRVTDGGNHAERVTVRLGRSSVNTIEILDGLAQGDIVILSDMSQWDAYDRVRLR